MTPPNIITNINGESACLVLGVVRPIPYVPICHSVVSLYICDQKRPCAGVALSIQHKWIFDMSSAAGGHVGQDTFGWKITSIRPGRSLRRGRG